MAAIDSVLSDLAIADRELNLYEVFRGEYFLFSVFPFYSLPKHSKKKRSQLQTHGIHGLTHCEGKILLDSGGFQLYRRNVNLDFNETLQIYDECQMNPDDHGIALDYCPFFTDPLETRKQKIEKTVETYKQMREQNGAVVPVIHGVTRKEFLQSVAPIEDNTLISYASNFPLITMTMGSDEILSNRPSVKQQIMERFLLFLSILKERRIESRVHVLGATGQNSSHLCWFAGLDQTDSSSWRLKAAYGKIALVGVSEAKVSLMESNFGVQKWKDEHDALLKQCGCPVCKGLNVGERKAVLGGEKSEGFRVRCVHNAFTYLQERDLAREMAGTLKYKKYLEKRFKGLWWAKFLQKVAEAKSQTQPQMALRQMTLFEKGGC